MSKRQFELWLVGWAILADGLVRLLTLGRVCSMMEMRMLCWFADRRVRRLPRRVLGRSLKDAFEETKDAGMDRP